MTTDTSLPVPLPDPDLVVIATLRAASGKEVTERLIHVKENDVTWRTADDHSEVNEMAWDVVAWTYEL